MLEMYYRVSVEKAHFFLGQSFRNMPEHELQTQADFAAVWLTDRPLPRPDKPGVQLRITLRRTAAQMAEYLHEEPGQGYRRWLVPTDLIASHGKVEQVQDETSVGTPKRTRTRKVGTARSKR